MSGNRPHDDDRFREEPVRADFFVAELADECIPEETVNRELSATRSGGRRQWRRLLAGGLLLLAMAGTIAALWGLRSGVTKPELSPTGIGEAALPDARPLHLATISRQSFVHSTKTYAPALPDVQAIAWRLKPDPSSTEPLASVQSFEAPQGVTVKRVNWPWSQIVIGAADQQNLPAWGRREVWSLATGKRIGGFRLEDFHAGDDAAYAISPDGARIAAYSQVDNDLKIASLATGEIEQVFPLSPSDSPLKWIRFLDANRLAAGSKNSVFQSPWLAVFTIGANSMINIRNKAMAPEEALPPSPGGAYVVVRARRSFTLLVYETQTGELVGEASFQFQRAGGRKVVATAFSPDGRNLACLIREDESVYYLIGIDVESGEAAYRHVLGTSDHGRYRQSPIPPVQWLSDGRRCVLFGREVFDVQRGASLGPLAEGHNRAWVFGDRLLLHSKTRLNVTAAQVQTDASQSTGTSVFGGGLPLESPDFRGVRTVDGAAKQWRVPHSAPPSPLKSPAALAIAPLPISVTLDDGSRTGPQKGGFNSVCFGKFPTSKVLLSRYNADHHFGWRRIQPCDLAGGRALPLFLLPRACEVVGMDDDRVLTINRHDDRRIDLWSAVDGSHVRGWRPYQDKVGIASKVVWADCSAGGKVLTLSATGELIGWQAETPRAVFRRETNLREPLRLNSNRNWLVGCDGEKLSAFDAKSGAHLGDIGLPHGDSTTLSLRADDRLLALVIDSRDDSRQLCICDLQEGVVSSRFAVVGRFTNPPRHVWISDRHVLFNHGAVVDVERGVHVWSFPDIHESLLGEGGGCAWMLRRKEVVGCRLEDLPCSRELVDAFTPSTEMLFSTGDAIEVDAPVEMQPNAEQCVTAAGFQVQSGAARKLRITVDKQATGDEYRYQQGMFRDPFGRPSSTDIVVEEVHLQAHVELVDATGAVAWSTDYTTEMPASVRAETKSRFSLKIDPSKANTAIRIEQWKRCYKELLDISLPRAVVDARGKRIALPGESKLEDELSAITAN